MFVFIPHHVGAFVLLSSMFGKCVTYLPRSWDASRFPIHCFPSQIRHEFKACVNAAACVCELRNVSEEFPAPVTDVITFSAFVIVRLCMTVQYSWLTSVLYMAAKLKWKHQQCLWNKPLIWEPECDRTSNLNLSEYIYAIYPQYFTSTNWFTTGFSNADLLMESISISHQTSRIQ